MKFNPFMPNTLVRPGMFSGRANELDTVEKCLFQTSHANPQHFAIEGERGIGKSSLFYYVQTLASGKIPYNGNRKFSFLVAHCDLGQSETQIDIARELGYALKTAISDQNHLKESLKRSWDFLSSWEILGVKFRKDQQKFDEYNVLAELVDTIEKVLIDSDAAIDGVLFLVDEADRPPEAAGLGLFLKLITERLIRRDCGRCVIGLAGLPTLISKLRASHASSPRIFETMTLDPLDDTECRRVIEIGIQEANKKNSEKTIITPAAIQLISHLSEGYPHFIQQFAYCAFDKDKDHIIDDQDVIAGAFEENGALAQLGHKYFNKMYFNQINSENYRIVLNTMAAHQNSWVSRQEIIHESGIGEHIVGNALKALRDREIIVADDSRRGFYKLPTRSFATWINAIKSVEEQSGKDGQFKLDIV